MARVCTSLNFAKETEEAFLFYQSVFGGEFTRGGIGRYSDIPASAGMPPVTKELMNLVMHVELPILGNHLLMGSDAPPEMGFTVNRGNNVQIVLEPDSKAETERLFNALSEGGVVTMNLQDAFWGSYFGTCTDRFGTMWMFNFTEKQ
jgi:PhnB protein